LQAKTSDLNILEQHKALKRSNLLSTDYTGLASKQLMQFEKTP
jgi:hypothetical protein